MCQPPPDQAVGVVLAKASVDGRLERILRIPSSRPQRRYNLQLADGKSLVLAMAPPSRLRLLRCEQRSTSTEAAVIDWLAEMQPSSSPSHDSRPESAYDGRSEGRRDTAARPAETCSSTAKVDLAGVVPRQVARSQASDELGSPYNIFDGPEGTAVRSLEPPLTPLEREDVEYQAGSLARQLASMSPTPPAFGPALTALSTPSSPSLSRSSSRRLTPRTTATPPSQDGSTSWTTAFHSLLEGALRDGEDMAVVLPYPAIRKHFRRLGYLLDRVTTPRLVVLDGVEDDNLLVKRLPRASASSLSLGVATPSGGRTTETEPEKKGAEKGVEEGVKEGAEEKGAKPEGDDASPVTVTGIRDWSQTVFGDPMFAAVFCEEPSTHFHRGFDEQPKDQSRSSPADDVIEDREMAPVRILLYRCYHLVVTIVKEFYRPSSQGSAREMAARKKLNETLKKLADIEDAPKSRHRRPSGEMSPAKKLRQDTPEDGDGGKPRKYESLGAVSSAKGGSKDGS